MSPGQEEDWRVKMQDVLRMFRHKRSRRVTSFLLVALRGKSPRLVMSTAAEIQIHA